MKLFNRKLSQRPIILDYDPATVSVENVLTGDIFSDLGDIFFFYEDKPSEGKLIITSAVWGSGEPSYTGTAVIAEVSIQITQLGEIDLVFDGSELFRDPDNESIQINLNNNFQRKHYFSMHPKYGIGRMQMFDKNILYPIGASIEMRWAKNNNRLGISVEAGFPSEGGGFANYYVYFRIL